MIEMDNIYSCFKDRLFLTCRIRYFSGRILPLVTYSLDVKVNNLIDQKYYYVFPQIFSNFLRFKSSEGRIRSFLRGSSGSGEKKSVPHH